MQGFNHIAGGLAFTGLWSSFHDINVFERPEYIGITVAAAILPDIDHTRSVIGKMVYPLAKWLSFKFGHRTITHSLVFLVGIIFAVRFAEIGFWDGRNTYSILIGYALLSHLIFDMCTRQGITFFYPFSTRPCVIPGNAAMRLRTNDLRSEALIFVLFCGMLLFCWPLFSKGFWQQYNETFMNYSHIQREARRKDDLLEITFLNANKDTTTGYLIDHRENTFVIYTKSPLPTGEGSGAAGVPVGWGSHTAKLCKFLAFKHTGKPFRTRTYQVFNVSPDSIKHYLKQPLIKLQLQCTQEMFYYEGAVLKSGKTINEEYTENFDFFIEQPDNTEQQAELTELQTRLNAEQAAYNQERNQLTAAINDVAYELQQGKETFSSMTDYQKGRWLKDRPNLEAEKRRLVQEKERLKAPNQQSDYQHLKNLKEALKAKKIHVSGNFVGWE